jgi:hypothetical protein
MKQKLLLPLFTIFLFALTNAQQWGYATLIAPQNSTTVTLIDTNNNVIKTWTGLTGQTAYSCYLMPGGYLWRSVKTSNSSFSGGGLAGRVQKVDWNGNILFDYTISDANQISHHDFCPMDNGDVLLIVYDKKTAAQMTAAGATSNTARQLEKIVQLHPTGTTTATIVWQWNLYDHLCQNANSSAANYVSSLVNNPQLFNVNYKVANDWWHMNGIDYNAALDQIVVSSHNMNEHFVIDHSTTTAQAATHTGGNSGKGGDFLYRWGNPSSYGATGTTIFNVTHDAHWIPADCPNAGWLVGMNNKGVSSSQSSIDMYQPTWNGSTYTLTPGQAYLPSTYNYRHACKGYTNNMGNSQQLPNGNMLVCLSTAGKIYEVTANGDSIWGYTNNTATYAQAFRYSKCYIENPSIVINNNSPAVCSGSSTPLVLSTTATATGVTNFSYQWAPATGLSSTTVANPSVTNLTSATTYTVTVSTTECTATASVTVGIHPTPNANAGNDVTISSGQSTTLTASGGSSYSWSNGANTASTTVTPSSTTTYTVTVTNASGCTATDQITVNVTGGTLSATAGATDSTLCSGASTQLQVVPSGGSGNYTYTWSSNPAGFSSQIQTSTVSPTVTTVYTVTVNDGSNNATAFVSVTVNPLPNVNAGNDVSIQFGSSAILTASNATNYVWSNGATTASQSVSPATTTTYTVTGTDGNGCSASDQVIVTVAGAPLSVVISATDSSICDGESAQLLATVTGGTGNYTYTWSSVPSGFSSSIYNPYINPTTTTLYSVTVSDGDTSVTAILSITVMALPAQPVITLSDTLLVSSSATNNQWFYYGNPVNGGTNQILDPTLEGAYQVQVIDANGCGSPLSEPFEYTEPISSVKDLPETKSVSLYPNPANNTITLNGVFTKANYSIEVFDCTGREVLTAQNNNKVAVEDLSNGFYVAVVVWNGFTVRKQFIVSK